eukprot:1096738-Karenia_brevis.AAC.1
MWTTNPVPSSERPQRRSGITGFRCAEILCDPAGPRPVCRACAKGQHRTDVGDVAKNIGLDGA